MSQPYTLFFSDTQDGIEISSEHSSKIVKIPTIFFHHAHHNWLNGNDTEFFKAKFWKVNETSIKEYVTLVETYIYFGDPFLDTSDNSEITLGFDIFGAIFFFLSSYEEHIVQKRDIHGRFLSTYSLTRSKKQIQLPLVNHYIEILKAIINILDPSLAKRPKRQFTLKISCDVDYPVEIARHSLVATSYHILRQLRNNNFGSAKRYFLNFIHSQNSNTRYDINNASLLFMCDELEKRSMTGLFYFIPVNTSNMDLKFKRDNTFFLAQAQSIFNRGHEIGIHPGYQTSKNQEQFTRSVTQFTKNFTYNCNYVNEIQNRFHYLRFDPVRDISRFAAHSDIHFIDSSLCYPDAIGFRNAICWSFDMYDLQLRKPTTVTQRPLLAMDVSLFSPTYMGLTDNEALEKLKKLSTHVQSFDGEFMVLFHNNQLNSDSRKRLFVDFLDFHQGAIN